MYMKITIHIWHSTRSKEQWQMRFCMLDDTVCMSEDEGAMNSQIWNEIQ